jgi:hypothetical protein
LTVIITAVVEAVKVTCNVPKNLLPLIAVIVGLLVGLASATFSDLSLEVRLWSGFLAGLSSVGLFELAMNRRTGYTKE